MWLLIILKSLTIQFSVSKKYFITNTCLCLAARAVIWTHSLTVGSGNEAYYCQTMLCWMNRFYDQSLVWQYYTENWDYILAPNNFVAVNLNGIVTYCNVFALGSFSSHIINSLLLLLLEMPMATQAIPIQNYNALYNITEKPTSRI